MHKSFPAKVESVGTLRLAIATVYRKNMENLSIIKKADHTILHALHGAYEAAMEYVQDLRTILTPAQEGPALSFLTDRIYAVASAPTITGALNLIRALVTANTLQASFHLLELQTGNTPCHHLLTSRIQLASLPPPLPTTTHALLTSPLAHLQFI